MLANIPKAISQMYFFQTFQIYKAYDLMFCRYTALIYKEIKSLSQTLIVEFLLLYNQMM